MNTRIKIIIIAATFYALLTTFFSAKNEIERGKHIPLAFSEIHSIQQICESKEIPVPTLTMLYAGMNDMVMKIFECSNTAYARTLFGRNTHFFASELSMRIDPSLKIHYYELPQFFETLPALANKALNESLDNFVGAHRKILNLNRCLSATWDDDHDDQYHTEIYYTTELYTDSDGSTHTQLAMHTRLVYDYTIHTYIYHPDKGETSSKLLEEFSVAYPNLELKEKLLIPSQTGAENEYAIEKSREKELDQRLNPRQLITFARNWATGSTLIINAPVILNTGKNLNKSTPAWKTAKQTARSAKYNTYSSSDPGPREFQVIENALKHGKALERLIGEIVNGLLVLKTKTPQLDKEIRALVGIEMDKEKGKANKHKRNILSISRQIYDANFKNGFSVQTSRWWLVSLWFFFGGGVGAGLGFGLDALLKLDFVKEKWLAIKSQLTTR